MDITSILSLLPLVIKIVNIIPTIQADLRTGGSVIETINKLVPDLVPLLKEIGLALFPTATESTDALQAGIDVVFDSDGTKWVQNSLNKFNKNTALVVDGVYGPRTKAAVLDYQTTHGLKADGWCGPKTSASLALELSKMT